MTTSYVSRLGSAPEEATKQPCVVSTPSNITLSGEQTINSLAVVAGNRVLVRNQTDASENGIYDVSTGAWTRSTDFNAPDDLISGNLAPDSQTGSVYSVLFSGTWVVDVTDLSFSVAITNGADTVVSNKAAAVLITPVANTTLFVNGTDGGLFKAITDAAPGTYSDNAGAYCGTQFIPTGGDGSAAWVRDYSGVVDARWFGGVVDFDTDNTAIIKAAITACHAIGYVEDLATGGGKGGVDLYIPSGMKWSESTIINDVTDTAGSTHATDITGLTITGDYTGAFVWNLDDFSYGTVISNTTTSVTVRRLLLGTTNTFTAGDNIVISYLKTGVNILDDSRWSEHNLKWTGQFKRLVNMDEPSLGSANENWTWGQYHPAHIVVNHNPSNMEKRASFLTRIYNSLNKIQSGFQIGTNPLNNVDAVANPDEAADVLLNVFHNAGVAGDNASSGGNIAQGWRLSADQGGIYHALGTRSVTNDTLHVKQARNELMRLVWNAKGTQDILFEFQNDAVVYAAWRIDGAQGSVRGIKPAVIPRTSNLALSNDYSGSTVTNTGAVGIVTATGQDATLAATIGAEFTLLVTVAQTLQFDCQAADQIRGTTGAGQTVASNNIGDSITFKCGVSGWWDVIGAPNGTWTFN